MVGRFFFAVEDGTQSISSRSSRRVGSPRGWLPVAVLLSLGIATKRAVLLPTPRDHTGGLLLRLDQAMRRPVVRARAARSCASFQKASLSKRELLASAK